MRSLLWSVQNRLFAVDLRHVREVCPVVSAHPLPAGPPCLLGLFDYHGALIPLLDAGILTGLEAVKPQLGSRTLLIEALLDNDPESAGVSIFGLRVEQTLGLRDLDAGGAWNPEGGLPGFGHLREVLNAPDGRVQVFDCPSVAREHRHLLQGAGALAATPERRLAP
ncbi:MAG: chemotaxis protein CheW [Planctomycetes bacterium]|nr:chemotaxis protein CheW [Planctomycetota bacterium]